ncbi:Very-long-chain 3-oxoacyl-CoA reductase [Lachnellula hyalina]|uniref:Very-long-chain 3-oxoacyl-CoA reductase n=1 Tax=Lachnellula hyalina TaxID=1316788 RepID=A0A8H8RBJ9_9HELO|nr:Very-long-chain 3-oxoacyl-CoA reductase [Lachnellula hyalina]TVY30336.1 Very-long-chain 3-oxoacyl-CoA reductase [Lachnellula hyalina]
MPTADIVGFSSTLSLSWIYAWIGFFYLTRKACDIYLLLIELFVLSGTDVSLLELRANLLRSFKNGEKSSWAIINGVEDDLGAEYALALASHGFNTLLLSRTQSKLDTLAQEIKSQYPDAQTGILLTDASKPSSDNYNELEACIKHLNVAILVNNDSQLHTIPVPFVSTPKEEITDIISVNCTATLMVTRLIAQGMAQRHRGLILTMGSFNGLFATPLLATYSGSKAFLQQWSTGLAAEMKSEGVDVQLVLSSTIAKVGEGSWLIPTPKDFVKIVLGKVGKTGGAHCIGWSMTPYWAHAFAQLALQNLPSLSGEIVPRIQKYMQERIRLRAFDTMDRERKAV